MNHIIDVKNILLFYVLIWLYLFQHAYALELLKDRLNEGERALDIGSGSGYLTACMAVMLGENGKAIGIDHISELVEKSIENIKNDNPELINSQRVVLEGN